MTPAGWGSNQKTTKLRSHCKGQLESSGIKIDDDQMRLVMMRDVLLYKDLGQDPGQDRCLMPLGGPIITQRVGKRLLPTTSVENDRNGLHLNVVLLLPAALVMTILCRRRLHIKDDKLPYIKH